MEKYIKCMCYIHNSISLMDCMTIGISIVTLVVTISIPIRIMQFQRYTNLSSMYMNSEFGYAFQNIIEFFHKECNCDIERIPEEYMKRYHSDFAKLRDDKIKIEYMLHYQRRLLSVYFYELECCRVSSRKLRKMIKKDWTTSESYVLKILICMNKVVDEQIKKDISEIKHQRIPKVKGISEYLFRLSTELKDGKSWMQL